MNDEDYVQPSLPEDEDLFATLEKRGEASVRADLETRKWRTNETKVRKWLHEKDLIRARKDFDLAARSTEAAEGAAQASERSADAAERSAEAAGASARNAKIAWIATIAMGLITAWATLHSGH